MNDFEAKKIIGKKLAHASVSQKRLGESISLDFETEDPGRFLRLAITIEDGKLRRTVRLIRSQPTANRRR